MLRLAPKAALPFWLVPTPRCTWMLLMDDAKSGKFTRKEPWLSGSFSGTPLTVVLMPVLLVPRMRMSV
jgi:hypothetical protein